MHPIVRDAVDPDGIQGIPSGMMQWSPLESSGSPVPDAEAPEGTQRILMRDAVDLNGIRGSPGA